MTGSLRLKKQSDLAEYQVGELDNQPQRKMKMHSKLKVLFLAAEAAPLVKVGGLGDVAGALPLALRSLPEKPDVRLVIPMHPQIDLGNVVTQAGG